MTDAAIPTVTKALEVFIYIIAFLNLRCTVTFVLVTFEMFETKPSGFKVKSNCQFFLGLLFFLWDLYGCTMIPGSETYLVNFL